jgi:DNA-directed RNA polymerase subunit omega
MEFPHNIDSKFRYILVAARRAQQLLAGSKARVQSESDKLTIIAQQELCAGLVHFETYDAQGNSLNGTHKVS